MGGNNGGPQLLRSGCEKRLGGEGRRSCHPRRFLPRSPPRILGRLRYKTGPSAQLNRTAPSVAADFLLTPPLDAGTCARAHAHRAYLDDLCISETGLVLVNYRIIGLRISGLFKSVNPQIRNPLIR